MFLNKKIIIIIIFLIIFLIPSPTMAFSFAVISDTPEGENATQGEALINSVAFLNEKKPDFIVLLGDLTANGKINEFDTFSDVFLKKVNAPVVPVAGNHDFLGGHKNWYDFVKKQSSELLPEYKGATSCGTESPPRFRRFTYKGIGFDLIDPYFDGHKYGLTQTELNCIDSTVAAGDLIFRHVTPYGLTCQKDGKICGSSIMGITPGGVTDIDQFPKKLISKNARAIFAAHTHGYYHGKCDGLEYINNGTLGLRAREYVKGWTAADIVDSFAWVDVEGGNMNVTTYVYDNSTKTFEPQTKNFPDTVSSKLILSAHSETGGKGPNEMEGVNATCTSIQPNGGGDGGSAQTASEFKIVKPTLAINIPQLKFSDIENSVDSEGYLHLPYIGEYISAVYKVGMVAISIIGVIMIIVVGVKITVLGGEERVAGFKRIGQIVIGLFIAWGSYSILYTINPALVNFDVLKVKYIAEEQLQTTSLTASDLADEAIGEGSPDKFKYFTKCPVDLTQPIYFEDNTTSLIPDLKKKPRINLITKNIPRRLEFHDKIVTQQILKGPVSQRVAMASEAAAQCQIQYENCGVGTTNVYALAAATDGSYGDSAKCLQHAKNTKKDVACNSIGNDTKYSPKDIKHDVTNLQTSYGLNVTQLTRGMVCDAKCSTKVWPEACFSAQDHDKATAKLVSILAATGKWDPNWINELQPGDYYMIVNWNSYCPGTHSALFLGWKDPAEHIAWVQMGDAGNFIRVGTKKLGKEAIIQISRPKEK